MKLSDLALVSAGAVGLTTAILHGIVMQAHIIAPLQEVASADGRLSGTTKRLIAPLLQVSTLAWLATGLLLVWAGLRASGEPRWVISGVAVAVYGHAAIANFLAVKGFYPGWMMMGVALSLVLLGAR